MITAVHHHGRFTNYRPAIEGRPDLAQLVDLGVAFVRDEQGLDFYHLAPFFAPGALLISIDQGNVVRAAGMAPNGMLPAPGADLYELVGTDLPRPAAVAGKVFNVSTWTFADPPRPPQLPVLTQLQARKALRLTGLKASVDAYIATLPEEAQEEWEYAAEIRRDHPIILGGIVALGLTEAQVDALFALGATLT